jgi:hypothetical protein
MAPRLENYVTRLSHRSIIRRVAQTALYRIDTATITGPIVKPTSGDGPETGFRYSITRPQAPKLF